MPSETIEPIVTEVIFHAPETAEIISYTQTDFIKIYLSGAILVVAVLILTYYAYCYYRSKYEQWLMEKEHEETKGYYTGIEAPQPVRINRNAFLIAGTAIVLVGLVQILL